MKLPDLPELNYLPSTTRDMVLCLLENYGKACWFAAKAEARDIPEEEIVSIPAIREATALQQFVPLSPPLETITRPNLTTEELAYYSHMTAQAWRVKACYDTTPEGLRPLRVCGKLAWPAAGAKKLLGVTA